MPPDRRSLLLSGDVVVTGSTQRRASQSSSRTSCTYDTRHEPDPDGGSRRHPLRAAQAARPRPARKFERGTLRLESNVNGRFTTLNLPRVGRWRSGRTAARRAPRDLGAAAGAIPSCRSTSRRPRPTSITGTTRCYSTACASRRATMRGGGRGGPRDRSQFRQLGVAPDGRRAASSCLTAGSTRAKRGHRSATTRSARAVIAARRPPSSSS